MKDMIRTVEETAIDSAGDIVDHIQVLTFLPIENVISAVELETEFTVKFTYCTNIHSLQKFITLRIK